MKWLEEALGLPPEAPMGASSRRLVDDPSLTVDAYLALKHLSPATRERFGLIDARVWVRGVEDAVEAPDGSLKPAEVSRYAGVEVQFPSGYYTCVLMPNDPPATPFAGLERRPRVRTLLGVRWPNKVIDLAGRKTDFAVARPADRSAGTPAALAYPMHAYGRPQFELSSDPMLERSIIVVEGESDVHALHDMGIPCCLGAPGVSALDQSIPDVLDVIFTAEHGDPSALPSWTVLVWSEPGTAGRRFPTRFAEKMAEWCADRAIPAPRVIALPNTLIAAPAGAASAGPAAEPAKDPCELVASLIPVHGGSAAPARLEAGRLVTQAAFTAAGRAAGDLDPAAPLVADRPDTAPASAPAQLRGSDPWEEMGCAGALPAPEPGSLPVRVEHLGSTFIRSEDGWSEEPLSSDGSLKPLRPICSIVEIVEVCAIAGEDHLVARAPRTHLGEFQSVRFPRSELADPRRISSSLSSIGVSISQRRGPAVAALLQALAELRLRSDGATVVPAATGWSGRCGTGPFAGLEICPAHTFGARMFEANERRRDATRPAPGAPPDTTNAARRWVREGLGPLLTKPTAGDSPASGVAPVLAIGAAAASVLVGPLSDVGVHVAPVVWIAGLGGGGKSITQKLAASIYSPALPDVDGQSAYFMNANLSLAALMARVDGCRDLPLILDDVTQAHPLPGSTARGDAARIEAAAALGMLVFNRKPIERATRDGETRQSRAFRSTAIFSAEVNMASQEVRTGISAGHRRRISTIEARPMTERGLGPAYAETVNELAASVGGAPGELLVGHVRSLVAARSLRTGFDAVKARVQALPGASTVNMTQVESLAVSLYGYSLLLEAIDPAAAEPALEVALRLLAPYLETGAGAGGATRDCDLTGVDAALRFVEEMVAAHPHRFQSWLREEEGFVTTPPHQGYLGKELKTRHDGSRVVVLTRAGMAMLENSYGIDSKTVAQAVHDGACKRRHTIRMDARVMSGTLWILPAAPPPEDDVDPSAPPPHDPDPHRLAGPPAPPTDDPPPAPPPAEPLSGPAAAPAPATYDAHERLIMDLAAAHPVSNGNPHETTRTIEGAASMIDLTFRWGAGVYRLAEHPDPVDVPRIHDHVRREARAELKSLQRIYALAAQEDGAPLHVVADPPADDDPRWAQIDNLGQAGARGYWQRAAYAIDKACREDAGHARDVAHEAHIKAYRVHLMARLRRPEWFVEVEEAGA